MLLKRNWKNFRRVSDMAYEKITWVNNETPLNAANMNRMEDGIDATVIDDQVLTLATSMGWVNPTVSLLGVMQTETEGE